MTDPSIHLTVNGVPRDVTVPASMTLLEMTRTLLELTGSKECCSEGECGACTMIVDGEPMNSCLILAAECDGAEITTIEGIGQDGMSPLQESFLATGAVQCGFCIPGMVVAATALLEATPEPTMLQVRDTLSGNLCRCGGYARICEAVMRASRAGVGDV